MSKCENNAKVQLKSIKNRIIFPPIKAHKNIFSFSISKTKQKDKIPQISFFLSMRETGRKIPPTNDPTRTRRTEQSGSKDRERFYLSRGQKSSQLATACNKLTEPEPIIDAH